MPRQSRRARTQSGARKREPNIPRHLLERAKSATLEPPVPVIDAAPDEVELPSDVAAATVAPALHTERPYRDASPVAARFGGAERTAPAIGRPAPAASKWATTDYGYVVGELKRIFLTALIVIVFLIVVALLKR